MTDEPATLPHVERAVDKARNDDVRWFESHPTRRYRLRDMHMFEFRGNDGSDHLVEGATFRVVAVAVPTRAVPSRAGTRSRGIVQRIPCILPDWLPNSGEHDELPDKEIKRILDYWLGYVKTIGP